MNDEWSRIAANEIAHAATMSFQQIEVAGYEMQRPCVLFRPKVYPDGNMWCALYGKNIQEGVAGFGDTPSAAMYDFDKNFNRQKLRQGGVR